MEDNVDSKSSLDVVAAEFMSRFRAGESPSVIEYINRYPNLADEIRNLFPNLLLLESLSKDQDQGPRYSLLAGVKRPEIVGDYRILQEVGRGGMGIVYEAERISLGRHVALKLLPFHFVGNRRAVERFQKEAKAAAKLHHPNIVPVFDFGEDDSVWYYAMQFIHGRSLHEVWLHLRQLDGHTVEHKPSAEGQISDLASGLLSDFVRREVDIHDDPDKTHDNAQALTAPTVGDESKGTATREQRIRDVLDECLVRRDRGDPLSDEQVRAEHPDLLPELEEELQLLRILAASRPPEIFDDIATLDKQLRPQLKANPQSAAIDTVSNSTTSRQAGLNGVTDGGRTHLRSYYHNVAKMIADVASALDYAHHQGVVHRDIKPSNLLLDSCGRIWITDFGLAQINSQFAGSGNDRLAGTLRYMSPEQVKGDGCDERSDIYSLGITLYELLTLRPAIDRCDYLTILQQICHEGPAPARQVAKRIPRQLEKIVMNATAIVPADRYQSAQQFADDLLRFTAGQAIAADRDTAGHRLYRWCVNHRIWLIGLSVVAVLLASIPMQMAGRQSALHNKQLLSLLDARRQIEAGRFDAAIERLDQVSYSIESGFLRNCAEQQTGINAPELRRMVTLPETPLNLAIVDNELLAICEGRTYRLSPDCLVHVEAPTAIPAARSRQVEAEVVRRFLSKEGVSAIDMCPESKTIVTGCQTGLIELWDSSTSIQTLQLQAHPEPVVAVVINSANLAVAQRGGAITWWHVPRQ